ncbi:MAG: alginate lyase [Flavobacteriaceae bacterium]
MNLKNSQRFSFICLLFLMISCQQETVSVLVKNAEELQKAIKEAKPGSVIEMQDGVWKDVQIRFTGEGTESCPITIKAQTKGNVFIEGISDLKFGGKHLAVDGLYFRNGYTPSRAVIEFRIDSKNIATHCRVTNTVIEDFNQLKRDRQDLWVEFWGRYNELDHCYIAGKTNRGPTVRVNIRGNESIKNYHQIVNNHFGPRAPKGGPSGETIQLGDSYTSMSPSHTLVANNLFEKCNGEVEVISSKTNFNEFRNNVFYQCEGSLVTRHGNYVTIDGNYFIGSEDNENIGGIRIINTGHWVTNNYFFNLKGKSFRSPLAVMNGIPKSPLNRYNQVTDVVVAYNTYVNCDSPWQFGVGTNISQKDVLPLSEIRSARPIRMLVANNIIYNDEGDKNPIIEHDKADGVSFKNNVIQNQGVNFKQFKGLTQTELQLNEVGEYVLIPTEINNVTEPFQGFDFETIEKDLFGNPRVKNNTIGAVTELMVSDPNLLDKKKYGTDWFSNEGLVKESKTIEVSNSEELKTAIKKAKNGDVVSLIEGRYVVNEVLKINKSITIKSKKNKTEIVYSGKENTPLFELHPYGKLTIKDVLLKGEKSQYAFASLKENMSNHFGLTVSGVEISNFNYVLKAYKESFAERITFEKTSIKDCENGIELSEETNDKGDYNTEYLTISNCQFENVKRNVIDYYRGGYDESTIGGNLLVSNSTFTNCGGKESNGILLNTRGIINVNIENNTFKNNRVKLVALLWGAKNNEHSGNKISNSGKILVEENIKLKLMY